MGRMRRRIQRKLILEQMGIVVGLVAAIGVERVTLGRFLWPAVVISVMLAVVLAVGSARRATAAYRSPVITIMELRERGRQSQK